MGTQSGVLRPTPDHGPPRGQDSGLLSVLISRSTAKVQKQPCHREERTGRGGVKQHLTGVSAPDTGGYIARQSARRPRTPACSRFAPRQPRQEAPGHSSVFSVPRPPRGPRSTTARAGLAPATGPCPREAKDLQGRGSACVTSQLSIVRVRADRRWTAAPLTPDDGLEGSDGAAGRVHPQEDTGVCAWEQGRPCGCGTTLAEGRTQGCSPSCHMRIF